MQPAIFKVTLGSFFIAEITEENVRAFG